MTKVSDETKLREFRRKNLSDLVRPDQEGQTFQSDRQNEIDFRKLYILLVESVLFLKQGRDYEDIAEKILLAIDACEANARTSQGLVRAIGEIAFWLIINGDRDQTSDALEKAVVLTKGFMHGDSLNPGDQIDGGVAS